MNQVVTTVARPGQVHQHRPKPKLRGDQPIELEMPAELKSLNALPRLPRPVSVSAKLTVSLQNLQLLKDEHLCGAGDETLELVDAIILELRAAKGLIGA